MSETELEVKEEAKPTKAKRVAKPKAEKPPKPEQPEEEIRPEIVVEAGEIERTVSAGTKRDTAANKEFSDAKPYVDRPDRPYKVTPKQFKDGEYCKVRVKFGITQSLGNYEMARLDVELEDFCRPDQVRQAWDQLKGKCTAYIKESAINVKNFLEEKEAKAKEQQQQDAW